MHSSMKKHLYCILLLAGFRSGSGCRSPEDIPDAHQEDRSKPMPKSYYPNNYFWDGPMNAKSKYNKPNNQSSQRPDDLKSQPVLTPTKGDIWQDSRYTQCVMVPRRNGKKICYPGSNKTDHLRSNIGNNCQLIDGKCYKVHRDWEFLRSYFSPPPTYILPCLFIGDECFLLDQKEDILLKENGNCHESFCYNLTIDSNNPENFCYLGCGNSQVPFEELDSQIDHEQTSDENVTSDLQQSPEKIIPEHNFQGKPTDNLCPPCSSAYGAGDNASSNYTDSSKNDPIADDIMDKPGIPGDSQKEPQISKETNDDKTPDNPISPLPVNLGITGDSQKEPQMSKETDDDKTSDKPISPLPVNLGISGDSQKEPQISKETNDDKTPDNPISPIPVNLGISGDSQKDPQISKETNDDKTSDKPISPPPVNLGIPGDSQKEPQISKENNDDKTPDKPISPQPVNDGISGDSQKDPISPLPVNLGIPGDSQKEPQISKENNDDKTPDKPISPLPVNVGISGDSQKDPISPLPVNLGIPGDSQKEPQISKENNDDKTPDKPISPLPVNVGISGDSQKDPISPLPVNLGISGDSQKEPQISKETNDDKTPDNPISPLPVNLGITGDSQKEPQMSKETDDDKTSDKPISPLPVNLGISGDSQKDPQISKENNDDKTSNKPISPLPVNLGISGDCQKEPQISKENNDDKTSNKPISPLPVQDLIKAMVPPNLKVDGNPSAIIYSVGLLFNTSEITLPAKRKRFS